MGQELEVTVWDRDKSHQDDLMGRTTIDLASMERETTHRLWRDLEDGAGSIFLLLTISGTTASETISDLAAHEETPQERERLLQKYSLANTLQRPRDVGHLTVKVTKDFSIAPYHIVIDTIIIEKGSSYRISLYLRTLRDVSKPSN